MTIHDRHSQAPGQAPSREWLMVEGAQKTFDKRMVVKGVRVNLKRRVSAGPLGPNGPGLAHASLPAAAGAGRGAPGH